MKCERFKFIDEEYEEKIDGYIIVTDEEIAVTYCAYGRISSRKYENIVEMAKDIALFKTKTEILEDLLESESDRADQLEDILEEIEIEELLEDGEE